MSYFPLNTIFPPSQSLLAIHQTPPVPPFHPFLITPVISSIITPTNMYSHQLPDMDKLIKQITTLTWSDLQHELEVGLVNHFSNLMLVGKLLSSRPLNKNTFHATIKAVWSFILDFIIEDIYINTFLFTFPTQQDKERVLANRPWHFKGLHMVLSHWPPGFSIP